MQVSKGSLRRSIAGLSARPLVARSGVLAALGALALAFELRPSLGRLLQGHDGPIDLAIGFRTETGTVAHALRFRRGHARALATIPADVDATLVFRDEAALLELVTRPAHEVLFMLLEGRMRVEGKLGHVSLFNYLLSAATPRSRPRRDAPNADAQVAPRPERASSRGRLTSAPLAGAPLLDEPFLAHLSIDDFPRLGRFLADHFETVPELCDERPLILTRFFREHGFERDAAGRPLSPVLRQARALAHLLEHKLPIVREGDLLAGTTTSKPVGVVLYPDAHGLLIWGELGTLAERPLNPYRVAPETADRLHREVFPFWLGRSFREWVRERHDAPLCQRIDERFAAYFSWKTVALSHTIPDFPRLLSRGARGLVADLDEELARDATADDEKREALFAMRVVLEGMVGYASNLARAARDEAELARDEARRDELLEIAKICERVPAEPATTLHEALQSIWIAWIALHMENTNAGLSLGRLDQWLEPYLLADAAKLDAHEARDAYVRRAVELVGCFFLRCADHLPLVPDVGNYLFGGSSSDQAITLGGVTPDGADGVVDMTFVMLKVTEMLRLRDPNVNARHNLEKNGDAYLRRLCEVNLVTAATPSMHGDENVMRSLAAGGYAPEHVRDWSATGCVEPTISGRHMGHTGSTMFNLVAPLEMALRDGHHPLMRWDLGPRTGDAARGDFATFDAFFAAYVAQLEFLTEQATEYNRMLGEAHAELRPTPLLSALIEGASEKGRDVTRGGARYNTSGIACIGLADVVDSLSVVRQLVFEDRAASFAELVAALDADFVGHARLLARIERTVPKFGSGDERALELANRVARLVHDGFARRKNHRGGAYTTGFWSMSNHVAFGSLTGALPSGRRAKKAFTPGLTPSPAATRNLLENLRDVAALDPASMDNNIAFNIKYVPAATAHDAEAHARAVDQMRAYVKTYFELGGMQMQLNVVSSAMLRDAMEHPESYRDLLVRISGYNAYFVTLNREMQIELIERAEYGS